MTDDVQWADHPIGHPSPEDEPANAFAAAVRAQLIAAHYASLPRVDGWRAYVAREQEPVADAAGRSTYVWRRFHLASLAVLPGLILVDFRWPEGHLADLRLLTFVAVGDADPATAAVIVKTYLECHLAKGWQMRLALTRLDDDAVLLSEPRPLPGPR